ncbi:hypothetical protein MUY14_42325 [Amycolatopsis sp. FBCC-B4732]|uniref:hypothetical protein n=1 Tax=Amycolatopsis sp. FBCC-B4732 TaxID=3079339 RepID=UPI001FF34549|nr:hypothetical protein [Amycolatopsis sp. FBCC-B4732]UOX88259.1 hypothetical protein MUY14_42325 [Amycolatopsis sp. FBCC-B4732]
MNDLKQLAALQARVFEFLAQQDEATLAAIADGEVQLAIAGSQPPSEQARRPPLENLTVAELKAMAKKRRLRGYSKLTRDGLVALLGGPVANEPAEEVRSEAPPIVTTNPDPAAAAIASHLRETETEEEGAAYLQAQRLDREGLLAVAAELQLTRVDRLNPKELEKRVLKQAIGARRKFAGLRKW